MVQINVLTCEISRVVLCCHGPSSVHVQACLSFRAGCAHWTAKADRVERTLAAHFASILQAGETWQGWEVRVDGFAVHETDFPPPEAMIF